MLCSRKVAELSEPGGLGGVQGTAALGGKGETLATGPNGFQDTLRFSREENQNGFGRRSLESFQKCVRGLDPETIRGDDNGNFVFGFGGAKMDFLHQFAHLVGNDDAGLGFRADPMDIGMIAVLDLPATKALVTAINRV